MLPTDSLKTQYHPLRLTAVTSLTDDSKMLTFEVPQALEAVFRFTPGQYLTLRTTLQSKAVARCYSICNAPDSGRLSVAIRKVKGGRFSTHAVDHFCEGQTIEVLPPSGHFQFHAPPAPALYAGIAGGSGITPIMSMIRHCLESGHDNRFVLFYANRSPASMMFREALQQLEEHYPQRFFLVPFFTEQQHNETLIQTSISYALQASSQNTQDVANIEPETLARLNRLPDMSLVRHWYLCGPQGMTDSLQTLLANNAIPEDRIHVELFGSRRQAAPLNSTDKPTDAPHVQMTYQGNQFEFHWHPQQGYLLDQGLNHCDDLPHACQIGACGTCKAKVIEGNARMDDNMALNAKEVEAGYILTCQAKPDSTHLVISFDD